jgi:hypothetical protein
MQWLNSGDLQRGPCEPRTALADKTFKKRQMSILKDSYKVRCKIFSSLHGAASPNLQEIAKT